VGDSFTRYRFVALLFFVGSFVWLATFLVEKQYHLAKRKRRLNNLAFDQKEVLKHFILNSKTTQAFSRSHLAIAKELAKSKILVESAAIDGPHPYFVIDPWAFAYLSEHPELAGLPSKKSN
jgi:hypothetical protein